jgi:hypothetical protein
MWALSKAGVVCNEYNVVKTMFYSYSESDTYSLTFLHSFLCVWDWKLSKVVYYCCSLSYYTNTFRSTGVSHHVKRSMGRRTWTHKLHGWLFLWKDTDAWATTHTRVKRENFEHKTHLMYFFFFSFRGPTCSHAPAGPSDELRFVLRPAITTFAPYSIHPSSDENQPTQCIDTISRKKDEKWAAVSTDNGNLCTNLCVPCP